MKYNSMNKIIKILDLFIIIFAGFLYINRIGSRELNNLDYIAIPTLNITEKIDYMVSPIQSTTKKFDNIVTQFNQINTKYYKTPDSLTVLDFIIRNEYTYLVPNGEYEKIKTSEDITFTRYVTQNHVYDIFAYETFRIIVSPSDGLIMEIEIYKPGLKTSRDIGIGDQIIDVLKKYGKPTHYIYNSYTYNAKGKTLNFEVDENNIITSILLSR